MSDPQVVFHADRRQEVAKSRELKNKPLVEAILELKWREALESEMIRYPHCGVLVGRLSDRVEKEYPFQERLPTADLPELIAGQMQVATQRFRSAENDWPLIQIGPGVMTFNETGKYTWPDFSGRATKAIQKLYEAHPKRAELKATSLMLRYIDAVEFNYSQENVVDFLRDKMKVKIAVPEALFGDSNASASPQNLNWQCAYRLQKPKGAVVLKLVTGMREGREALIWETIVQTAGEDMPVLPDGFAEWLAAAHKVTDTWFFTLIEGELERRFSE
jgi:uncharacterized protein (TIGR04255 family)